MHLLTCSGLSQRKQTQVHVQYAGHPQVLTLEVLPGRAGWLKLFSAKLTIRGAHC